MLTMQLYISLFKNLNHLNMELISWSLKTYWRRDTYYVLYQVKDAFILIYHFHNETLRWRYRKLEAFIINAIFNWRRKNNDTDWLKLSMRTKDNLRNLDEVQIKYIFCTSMREKMYHERIIWLQLEKDK